MSIEEVFDQNIFQFAIANIRHLNGVMQHIANRSTLLVYEFLDFQLALGRVDRNRYITAGNLDGDLVRRLRLFILRSLVFVSEPVMQCSHILQFVVSILTLTGIGIQHNVIIFYRDSLASRNSADLDDCGTGRCRFQSTVLDIRDNAVEVVLVVQRRIHIVNSVIVVHDDGIMHRIADVCNGLVCLFYNGGSDMFRRGSFGDDRDINLIGRNLYLAGIRHICHFGVIDKHGIGSIFIHYRVGVDNVYALTSADRRNIPDLVANIAYNISVFGRRDNAREVVCILDLNIRLGLVSRIGNGNGVSHHLANHYGLFICLLLDFGNFRNLNSSIVYGALVAFLYGIGDRNLNDLTSRNFCDGEGMSRCVIGVLVGTCSIDFANAVIEVAYNYILSSHCAVVRNGNGVVNGIANHHTGFKRSLHNANIAVRHFAYMDSLSIGVARNSLVVGVLALSNSRIHDVTVIEVHILCHSSVDISDFNGFACVQLRNHPLAVSVIHQIASILDSAVAVGCIGNDNIRQLGIAAVLNGQSIGYGRVIAVHINEALVSVLYDGQFITEHINLNRLRRLFDVLVTRNLSIGILGSVSSSYVDNRFGVTVLHNIQVIQRNGIADIQSRNGEQSDFGVIGISVAGRDDKHTQSIGVIGDGNIRHIDSAVVCDSDLILDDFAGISVVAVSRLDNRQVLVVQRHNYFVGIDRFLRNSRVFASGNRCGSNVIQLAVCEVICNNRVLIGDGYGLTNAKAGDCPCSIIVDTIAEVELRVLDRLAHKVVRILYDNIFKLRVARIGDFQRVSDDITYASLSLISTLFDGQILTDDFHINIRSLNQPILVRLGIVRSGAAIRVLSIALDYLHIGNLGVVFEDIVVVGAVVGRVYRVGIGERYGIGMGFIAQMGNLCDNELALLCIIGHTVCLRQDRNTNEVVGIFNDDVVQVMTGRVRNSNRVANHIVIRSAFTVSRFLDRDNFLIANGQSTIHILDDVVGIAAAAIFGVDDNCIAGNVLAGTHFGLRTGYGHRIHLIVNTKQVVIYEFRSVGIAGFRQRSAVIYLFCGVCSNGYLTRVNEEMSGSYCANLNIIYLGIGRNNGIAGVLGTNILTRNTSCIQIQGTVDIIAQVLIRSVRLILLVRERIGNIELIGVVITVGLAVVFCLDVNNQGFNGQLTIDVNEIVVRVMEGRILGRYRIFTNRAPLLCISLGLERIFTTDIIDGVTALIAGNGYVGCRVIFAEILFVVNNCNNDGCRNNGQSSGSGNDFVVAGRVSAINGDGILAYLLTVISISTGTLCGDIEEVFVTGIDQLFGVSNRPSQRVGVFLSVNLLLVICLHMDRFLTNRQVTANIDKLVIAVVSNQLLSIVVDGIITNFRLIRYGIASVIVAVHCSSAGDLGFIVLDTGTGFVLNVTTDKTCDGISEFGNLIAVGGLVSAIDRNSEHCGDDFQRTIVYGNGIVLVVCIVLCGNEVITIIEGSSPLIERICCSDIAAHNILTFGAVQLNIQRAVFGVNQANHIASIVFVMEGKCRVSSTVGLDLMVNANNQFLRVDSDIAIDIADNIVLLEVCVALDFESGADMLFTVFQNNAIRVHRILIVVASSYDVLASVRQVEAQSSEAKFTVQNGFLRVITLKTGNIGIKCGILFAIGLGIATLYGNNQLSRSNRKVAVLHGNNVVGDAILADRADIVGIDGVSLAERMLASPDIFTGFTSHASTFEVAGLDRHIRAFLLGENRAIRVLNVVVAIFATDTVMECVLQFGVSVAVNLGVIRSNNGNGTRNDSQVASGNRDVVIIIDGAVDTGQADAILVSAAGTGLRIQMGKGKGIGVDTGFLCRDFNSLAVFYLKHMIGVIGRTIVEAVDTVAVIANLIIHGNHQTLTLDNEVVCVTVLKVIVRVIQLKLFLVVCCEVSNLTVLRRGVDGIRTDFFTLCTNQIEDDGNLIGVHNNACIRDTAACAELLLTIYGIMGNHIGQGEILNLISIAQFLLPASDFQQHRTRFNSQNTGRVVRNRIVITAICVFTRYENRMLFAVTLITIQVIGTDIGVLIVSQVDVIAQSILCGFKNLCGCAIVILQSNISSIAVLQANNGQRVVIFVIFAVVTLLITEYDCQRDRRNGHLSVVRFDDIVACCALFVRDTDGIAFVTYILTAVTNCLDAEHFAGRLNDFAIDSPLQCGFRAAVCFRCIQSRNANQTRMYFQNIGLVNELVVGNYLSFTVRDGLDAKSVAVTGVFVHGYRISVYRNMGMRMVIVMIMLMTLVHFIVFLQAVSAFFFGNIRLIDYIAALCSSCQIRQIRSAVLECQSGARSAVYDFNYITDGIIANQMHVVVINGSVITQNGPVVFIRNIQFIALVICAKNLECGVEERVRCTVNLLAFVNGNHNLAGFDLDRTGVFRDNIVLQYIIVELVQTNVRYGVRTSICCLTRYYIVNELALIVVCFLRFQVEFFIVLCSSLMVFDQTFHGQPAVRTLIPVVDIVCIRKFDILEAMSISGAYALDLRTQRRTVNTTAESLVCDIVVVVVVVHKVHFIVLFNVTYQCVRIIDILYSVLKFDVYGTANRNRVNVELCALLVHTNAICGFQGDGTITCKSALQTQVLDSNRSNIIVLRCQTISGILVRYCNRNSHLLTNLRGGRAVAVLYRIRQMANRIRRKTIVTVFLDDTIVAVCIIPGQLFASIAVSIRTNIGLSIQFNGIVVGDIINIDISLSFFTDIGVVVGIIYLDVVRIHYRVLVVILFSLGIAGNIDVFLFTSKNHFICLLDSHILIIVDSRVGQILAVSDIIGVTIVVPLVFVHIMILTVNIQRTRIDGTSEIFTCNIIVVKRVVNQFKNRNGLDTVQTRMDGLSETRFCEVLRSIVFAIIAVSQCAVQRDSIAVNNTGISSCCFDFNIRYLCGADIVVNLIVVIAVKMQRARINIEVYDITVAGYIFIRCSAFATDYISLAGLRVLPAESNFVLARVGCRSSVGAGTNERLLLAIGSSVGRICDVGRFVVRIGDVYTAQDFLFVDACIGIAVPYNMCGNSQLVAVVHLVSNSQHDLGTSRSAFICILEANIHCVLANAAVQTLIQVNDLDFCTTSLTNTGTGTVIQLVCTSDVCFNDDVAVVKVCTNRSGIRRTTQCTIGRSRLPTRTAAVFVQCVVVAFLVFSLHFDITAVGATVRPTTDIAMMVFVAIAEDLVFL